MELAPRQHGLEHIARIQCAVRLARADNGVQLVDEQNDLSVAVLDIVQHRLQTFLKLTSVFCTGNQCSHIQCKNLLVLQALRHIASDDTLSQSLDNGCFTDAGFTDQHRVVLCLSGQNTDHITNLRIPADHGIKLLVSRLLHKILTVFLQRVIGCLRVVTGHPLIAADG